jgi:hypothetical protein
MNGRSRESQRWNRLRSQRPGEIHRLKAVTPSLLVAKEWPREHHLFTKKRLRESKIVLPPHGEGPWAFSTGQGALGRTWNQAAYAAMEAYSAGHGVNRNSSLLQGRYRLDVLAQTGVNRIDGSTMAKDYDGPVWHGGWGGCMGLCAKESVPVWDCPPWQPWLPWLPGRLRTWPIAASALSLAPWPGR